MEKAVEMFGDHFVPIEEAERQRAEAVPASGRKAPSGAARQKARPAVGGQNAAPMAAEEMDLPPLDDVPPPDDDDAPPTEE